MEKLSEKQNPNMSEIRKTLVGLGNVLIQAGIEEDIDCRWYSSIMDFTFTCGKYHYVINSSKPYNEDEYQSFVESIKDDMKKTIADYDKQIFSLECSKAIMEVYLTEKNK